MSDGPRVSVIVASRHRPNWLRRCLTALRQVDYPAFEVIVVADSESLASVEMFGLKRVRFDEPNLSRARNAGIAASSGEICAFIDDDAVPEPLWLAHHVDVLATTRAAASVGFVRGRNGLSFQSRVTSIDREAETHVEEDRGEQAFVPRLSAGRALKLVGTNMAVRRDILTSLGGFDPAFAWFLDDADLSMRLCHAGHVAAVAPLAEVHHGFAASARRTADRVPLDLHDIGRSSALFFRRHPGVDVFELLARIETRERARLLRHMIDGGCEPGDVGRILKSFKEGWQEGLSTLLPSLEPIGESSRAFVPLMAVLPGHEVLTGRLASRRGLMERAGQLVASGQRCSVFSFSLTNRRHRVRYVEPGFWLQTGGQFGRAERSEPWIKWCRFAYRKKVEVRRVANVRGIREIVYGAGHKTCEKRDIGGVRDA